MATMRRRTSARGSASGTRRTTARSSSGGRRLTAKQRNKLPNAAFVDRVHRRFPVPTKAQAKKAGISESHRQAIHRNALARGAQHQPTMQARGKGGKKVKVKTVTHSAVRAKVRRAGTAVKSVKKPGGKRGRKRS